MAAITSYVLQKLIQVAAKGKPKEVGQKTSFELTIIPSVPLSPNLLSCQLEAHNEGLNSSQLVEYNTITITQPGICTVHYTPTVHGPHQLRIAVGGSDILNSPFTVNILPSPEMRGHPLTAITRIRFPRDLAVSESGEVMMASELYDHCIS